jgi:hypothetical protein
MERETVCCERRSTLLLKRHILTPFAVPAGLKATVRCVLLMHAYAAALQSTHGLTVGPRISKELWPVIEQVKPCILQHVLSYFFLPPQLPRVHLVGNENGTVTLALTLTLTLNLHPNLDPYHSACPASSTSRQSVRIPLLLQMF